jgi:RNA polymerase sigma factor (TIGR02999 family)
METADTDPLDAIAFSSLPACEQEEFTTMAAGLHPSNETMNHALPALYDELRALAAAYLRRERPDHTLQPTALVHESYLRLREQRTVDWNDRLQFLSIAARMMRRILANYAAARATAKRGSNAPKLDIDAALDLSDQQTVGIAAVEEALSELERFDARQARIVELRFFGGLTFDEVATVVGVSSRTAKREWSVAKRWLQRELSTSV